MKTIFGREPALIMAVLSAAVSALATFAFTWTDTQVGVLNTVLGAAFGLAAVGLKSDRTLPLLLGLAEAILFAALAFGVDLDAKQQSVILMLVSTVAAVLFVRPQVVAKTPPVLTP